MATFHISKKMKTEVRSVASGSCCYACTQKPLLCKRTMKPQSSRAVLNDMMITAVNHQLRASNKTHDFLTLMASAVTNNDWHVDILWDFAPMLLRKGANIWQPRVPKRAWNSHAKMLDRRSMHMFPRWATCHVECPHLSFSPFLTRKQREAWIVIWSTWTLDDLEFLGSLFQVWLKSRQRIFYTTATASIHSLQSIDEAGSLLLSAICLLRWAFYSCSGFAFRCSFPSLMFALIYIDIK